MQMEAYRSAVLALTALVALALSPLIHAEDYRSDAYQQYPSRQYQEYPSQQYQSDRYSSDRYANQRHDGYQDDRYIHDQVHDAIEDALGHEARRIRVTVRGGHVYLSGSVRDSRTRSFAHDIAHDIPGVHGVFMPRLYVRNWR